MFIRTVKRPALTGAGLSYVILHGFYKTEVMDLTFL